MSVNPTQFSTGPTRQIQPGDTPDLNDGLLARPVQTAFTIVRGNACVMVAGAIEIATTTNIIEGRSPIVPIQDGDNSGGVKGDVIISGVTPPQRVALLVTASSPTLNPGDFVKPNDAEPGTVERWAPGAMATDDQRLKYARYLGKEAALLDKNPLTPFDETLTPGIVPDETLVPTTTSGDEANVGWFQLIDTQGGTDVV